MATRIVLLVVLLFVVCGGVAVAQTPTLPAPEVACWTVQVGVNLFGAPLDKTICRSYDPATNVVCYWFPGASTVSCVLVRQ